MNSNLDQLMKELDNSVVINSLGDAMSIQDINYNILYQNDMARELIGDHVGKSCYKAFENKNVVCEECPLELTFNDGKIRTVERVHPSKKAMVVEITVSPIKDSSGNIIAGIEVVRDISHRNRTEQKQDISSGNTNKDFIKTKSSKEILHMCCSCNKIHDDKGNWTFIDVYIKNHSDARLSHGFCPECAGKHYPKAFRP